MKTKILFVLFLTILYGCTGENIQNNTDITAVNQKIATRAIVDTDNPSVSNPLLIDNWEDLNELTLNSGNRVTLPWRSGSLSTIPFEMSTDIKKEDGWKLLVHTFKEVGLDVGQNYMIFYNELRGLLKVFYFKEGQPNPMNGFLWYIEQSPSSNTIFENGDFFLHLNLLERILILN
jgi:hypothetical protein